MNASARYLGKYQLIKCIGRGGMGEVWKALDCQLKREVAIKILCPQNRQKPDFSMRFEQEARLIASLHHPNIIEIHDFKIQNCHSSSSAESDLPLCYMVMDYVPGETLADYLYRRVLRKTSHDEQLSPAVDVVYLFTVIGLALDYAHQCGIIHRDIKPANILLDQRIPTVRPMGEPILTDFGIARQCGVAGGTIVGCIIGTPKYMAPEQARGYYDDPRSDLYSLGIILYEMMTGVTPFHADTPLAIVMQHLYEKPIAPEVMNPHIPSSISQVILKSIAKEPDARFSTAAALAVALAEAFNVPTSEHLAGSSGGRSLGETPQSTPLQIDRSGPIDVEHPKAERRGEAKPSWLNNKKWVFGLVTLFVLVLLSLNALVLFLSASHGGEAVIGHVRFVKHGSSQNYNALQIDMRPAPALPHGMAYYAWIELGNEDTIPHWELPISHQAIHTPLLTYAGVENLYVSHRRLLITKEQTNSPPDIPNPTSDARLYYGLINPTPSAILDLQSCFNNDGVSACS